MYFKEFVAVHYLYSHFANPQWPNALFSLNLSSPACQSIHFDPMQHSSFILVAVSCLLSKAVEMWATGHLRVNAVFSVCSVVFFMILYVLEVVRDRIAARLLFLLFKSWALGFL